MTPWLFWATVIACIIASFAILYWWAGRTERERKQEDEWREYLEWCRQNDPQQATQWEMMRRRT